MITREYILSRIEEGLKDTKQINAIWLEGSDGTNSMDQYSDIDIVFDVEDGFGNEIFSLLENILTDIGRIDLSYEEPRNNPNSRYKVYHLQDTPDSLFLDITVQISSEHKFITENDSEIPYIIFDKKGVVQYESLDADELNLRLINRLYHLENMMNQKARAKKYVKRNKFLEAMGYYHKFVVTPLIELLRIKYKPINHDYYIVSISKHLPPDVLGKLEELFKIGSVDDLEMKIEQSQLWFSELLKELREELEKP
ncbi:aminoglycoside 6-adenylyltransferase [Paenibacillus sp. sptzw28]|uniref:aminoglycoside 6-adenylyltransferase n=1 Tax=Paenibacillus sp. sptzw28 TaxID=715179 RepID=UPI001C6E335E|nr:aminoglycoside 6-adenylyltransferase [Paenibacillus sp. sptzw28]QYR19334.1 aminoglycoside 6-adenylyltransferase [Paenibacillus sp. sptzw28]